MNNFMILRILTIVLLLQIFWGQQTQNISPYSQNKSLNFNNKIIELPKVNNEEQKALDIYQNSATPYRYGYIHETNFSQKNSGIWVHTVDGGKIWRISFQSEGAYSISFEYENFYIPKGGQLHIIKPDYDLIQGAYTHINNNETGQFSTPHLKGDLAIIEYYQPPGTKDEFSINIIKIIHDYRDIMGFYNNERDWECGVNVICETSSFYQDAINSVAFLDMGAYICSGAMVNNVRQDLTPYFLTAWHCIDGTNPNIFRFYFNKEASSCDNTWGSSGEYAYSSDLVAHSDGIPGGDWALLLIDDEIEEDWEVFYAGWDVTENYPIISCGVHHPGGTPKKINYDNDIAYGAWWDNAADGLTHWQINWDEGGSEGGSSGSPAFNDRFQIIGVLTGGSGGCGDGWPSLYGKMNLAWNWDLSQNRRLIDWLDPDYSGALVIDGTYEIVEEIIGDLNSDNFVNILDIIQLANMILNNEYTNIADLNNDSTLNILDIIFIVNIILDN